MLGTILTQLRTKLKYGVNDKNQIHSLSTPKIDWSFGLMIKSYHQEQTP